MTLDGVRYLSASSFGSLVFLKCSAATIYGALDVLEVSFSELSENEEANDLRLGLLFAFSGLGTVFGTLLTEFSSDMNDPRRLQSSCVWAFLFIALSYLGMGIFPSFVSPCIFTVVDSASATLLWIVSDLLLQVNDLIASKACSCESTFYLIANMLHMYVIDLLDDFRNSANRKC